MDILYVLKIQDRGHDRNGVQFFMMHLLLGGGQEM
jgi:hypothetical protein